MIICLQTRTNELHYISWSAPYGIHYTMCGKTFSSKDHPNTYGIDQSVPEACPRCQAAVNWGNKDSETMRYQRGDLLGNRVYKYNSIQSNYDSPEYKYDYVLKQRFYPKLNRMLRKKTRK